VTPEHDLRLRLEEARRINRLMREQMPRDLPGGEWKGWMRQLSDLLEAPLPAEPAREHFVHWACPKCGRQRINIRHSEQDEWACAACDLSATPPPAPVAGDAQVAHAITVPPPAHWLWMSAVDLAPRLDALEATERERHAKIRERLHDLEERCETLQARCNLNADHAAKLGNRADAACKRLDALEERAAFYDDCIQSHIKRLDAAERDVSGWKTDHASSAAALASRITYGDKERGALAERVAENFSALYGLLSDADRARCRAALLRHPTATLPPATVPMAVAQEAAEALLETTLNQTATNTRRARRAIDALVAAGVKPP